MDHEAWPVGRAYRLVIDDSRREQTVLDPDGAELGVVAGKGFEGSEYGLCWAERLVERDLGRRDRRGLRKYEVSAEVDGGPRDRAWLGTERVEARTSAGPCAPCRHAASRAGSIPTRGACASRLPRRRIPTIAPTPRFACRPGSGVPGAGSRSALSRSSARATGAAAAARERRGGGAQRLVTSVPYRNTRGLPFLVW